MACGGMYALLRQVLQDMHRINRPRTHFVNDACTVAESVVQSPLPLSPASSPPHSAPASAAASSSSSSSSDHLGITIMMMTGITTIIILPEYMCKPQPQTMHDSSKHGPCFEVHSGKGQTVSFPLARPRNQSD